jgi:hypothetical protein
MITVLSFRKSDGRTETISIQSNGINLATMIQDAVTRLVDFKMLNKKSEVKAGDHGHLTYESEEFIVNATY